ncbi:unnamed protein product [Calicophoron daubneyi]|uniref:Phosphatidylinositol-4,5-bisphosphate 4-phosphatase n=1 Tax=Calicophoron daubneyi TaxID=300641 RepID=A0AAV2TAK5_CALDB
MGDETTPLLPSGLRIVLVILLYPVLGAPVGQNNRRLVVGSVEPNLGDPQATINCQVCNHVISLDGREKQMVVKCPSCGEATPIKGPPAGKQYVRCPCNCLLICNATTTRVGCPRPECQKVIVLSEGDNEFASGHSPSNLVPRGSANPYSFGNTFGAPQNLRVACGNCNSPFSVANTQSQASGRTNALISCLSGGTSTGTASLIAARCPHCRKVTSVGPAYARIRIIVYGFLALIVLIIAIGVTVGTANVAKENKALYFLWAVLYFIALVLGLRAIVFLMMPVSTVEVPVLQI